MSDDPRSEYERRRSVRDAARLVEAGRDRVLSNVRLAVFAVFVAGAFAIFGWRVASAAWLLVPAAAFAALLIVHERVVRARERLERAVAFYDRGLARLAHTFAGSGTRGDGFADPAHPYASDLDIFGHGSLFELLCLARTGAGESTLAAWLAGAAEPGEIEARQQAVAELRGRLDLREDLALLGGDVEGGLHPQALRAWGEAPPAGLRPLHGWIARGLVAVTLATIGLWIATPAGPIPFIAMLAAQGAYAASLRARASEVIQSVDTPSRDLDLLASVLERLEAERFQAPALEALRASLDTGGQPPSARVARLHRLVELMDARRNQLFAPISAVLLWGTQFAVAIERWRTEVGPHLGDWIDAMGAMEALSSLSAFAYERPDLPFPTVRAGDAPVFRSVGLGHPLIAPEHCVRNDLTLGDGPQVLVVSGSNMSGKSTLLRAAGINAALAQAGSVVCAESLEMTPLAIGASIRIVDSLQDGASHFFAEITRIREVVALTENEDGPAVLFLLDEIFHGTNSHDRGIGAEAIVKSLLARGAIGLVTTHDLALAEVAEQLAPATANVHFADQIEDGQIAFDYTMRPGVVRRSNALALMRLVGLPVDVAVEPDAGNGP